MLIRYEAYGYNGLSISQSNIDDFIRSNFKEEGSYREDLRSDMQIKLDGTCELLCNMITILVKKGLLTIEEFGEMLPKNNYSKLISFDEEWESNL